MLLTWLMTGALAYGVARQTPQDELATAADEAG